MLFNKTANKKIIDKVFFAETPWQRLKGLMFESPERFSYALLFTFPKEARATASIHMLFVFFPIDAVFLDRQKRVVDIAKNLQPFTPSFTPKKAAKFLIELPAGKSKGIGEGHELEWQQ